MSRLFSLFAIVPVALALSCAKPPDGNSASASAGSAGFPDYTVPAGTVLNVRLVTTVASNANREGDPVEAVLTDPVVIDDRDVLPTGAVLKGVVSDVEHSAKVKGRAHISLRFTRLVTFVRGEEQEYSISAGFTRVAPATKGEDAKKIGVGTAAGAVVGGLIGGGKGAAAGAAVGAGGGTAVVLATPGEEVKLNHGTILALRLAQPVTVKVPPVTR